MIKFKVGDEVKFDDDDCMFVQYGKVIRVNKKTLTIEDSYGRICRVEFNKVWFN